MMKATGPIDSNITEAVIQLDSTTNRAPSISLTEGEKTIKDRAIFTNIKALELPKLILLSLRGDTPEEGDIIIGMEAAKIPFPSRKRFEDLHVLKQAVVGEKGMGHTNAMGFHWVTLSIVVIAHLWVVEITHLSLNAISTRW